MVLKIRIILLILLFPSLAIAWTGKVVHVADGDTITVMRDHKRFVYASMGSTHRNQRSGYGQNAYQFASAQVMGKRVRVETID